MMLLAWLDGRGGLLAVVLFARGEEGGYTVPTPVPVTHNLNDTPSDLCGVVAQVGHGPLDGDQIFPDPW